MSDRLRELKRQRALVADHLAWLDEEIEAAARESSPDGAPISAAPVAQAAAASSFKSVAAAPAPPKIPLSSTSAPPLPPVANPPRDPEATAAADAILADYRVEPDAMKSDLKKGCWLYFAGALAFVALVVVVLYFAFQRK